MKIELLQQEQIQKQIEQIAALTDLCDAVAHLNMIAEDTLVNLDMQDKVHNELKKVIGKSESEIQKLRKQDCFLDTLIDEYWTAPFDKDMQKCEKYISQLSTDLKQNRTNIIRLYNLLNPSNEFLKFLYDQYVQDMQEPEKYHSTWIDTLNKWVALLKPSLAPDFKGFSDSEKSQILCGPIKEFLFKITFSISDYSITPINQIKLDKQDYLSLNLPARLSQKQATLYVPPRLGRFAFKPINDEYDRALLRVAVFNDMITMVQNYLNQSNKTKPFNKMDQIGLQEFNFHVNNWKSKIYPECRKQLSIKKLTLTEIIQIMQDFLVHVTPPKTDQKWYDTSKNILELCKNIAKEHKSDPKFSEYEYQVIFFELICRHMPTNARIILQEAYKDFTPDKISNIQDDESFYNSVFIGRNLKIQNMNAETIYSLASNLKHKYVINDYNTDQSRIAQSDKLRCALENGLKSIVMLNPSDEVVEFAKKLTQNKQH